MFEHMITHEEFIHDKNKYGLFTVKMRSNGYVGCDFTEKITLLFLQCSKLSYPYERTHKTSPYKFS